MRKLLYAALAALMLISCDPNGPKIDSKDKKMLDKASKEIMSLIGKDRKEVKAAFEKAGWEDASFLAAVPKRFQKNLKYDASSTMVFAYGDIDGYMEVMMEEDEDAFEDWLDNLIKEKKIFAAVMLNFVDKKLTLGEAHLIVGNEYENIHNLYLNFSKNIYASADPDSREWEGALMEYDDHTAGKEPDTFSDKKRAKFEEAFAELDEPFVQEQTTCEHEEFDTVFYALQWSSVAGDMGGDNCCEGMLVFGIPE